MQDEQISSSMAINAKTAVDNRRKRRHQTIDEDEADDEIPRQQMPRQSLAGKKAERKLPGSIPLHKKKVCLHCFT